MKKIFTELGGCIAMLALMVTTMNVNSTCFFMIHQPKLPANAEKLRKYN